MLDIDNNPLNCNADFMTLITWLTKRNVKAGDASLEQGRSAKLELLLDYPKSENHETWQKIVYKACKRTNYQPEVPEVQSTTTPKLKEVEMKPKKEKPVDSTKIKDSESLDDDDDYYDSEYEDEDIDENAEMIDNDKDVKEKDLFVKELDIIQKMQGELFGKKVASSSKKGKVCNLITIYRKRKRFRRGVRRRRRR